MKTLLPAMAATLMVCCFTITALSQEAKPLKPHPQAGYHIYAHAHNDYEHPRPLLDALDNRFYSVEVDFWMVDGEILVSHDKEESKEDYKGTLKELYLDPLQKRVDEKGSVHGDGLPFYLWLDIKDGRPEVHPVLRELLSHYSMMTVFTDEEVNGEVKEGPVTIILTGDHESKSSYMDQYNERRVCRDSNSYDASDPNADNKWLWYALNWNSHFSWKGRGLMPPEEIKKLQTLVNDIHAKGRKVRFYAVPDNMRYWMTAIQNGCGLINTDKLAELNEFLEMMSN